MTRRLCSLLASRYFSSPPWQPEKTRISRRCRNTSYEHKRCGWSLIPMRESLWINRRRTPLARENVEKALMEWGRFRLVLDGQESDLVIVIRTGNGRMSRPTMQGRPDRPASGHRAVHRQ